MKESASEFNEESPVEVEASVWLARLDRGLTADEQDAYTDWLSADPAHREAMAEYQSDWEDYDRLAGIHLKGHARIDPDLLAPEGGANSDERRFSNKNVYLAALPFAALLAFAAYMMFSQAEEPSGLKLQPATELLARIEQRTLEDGTVIEINRGAELEIAYGPTERKVFLKVGEAHFNVAKDLNRPFVVNVAGVDVQAIGTIFSIRLSEDEVDVIVTEGIVNVKPEVAELESEASVIDTFLEIGQRAKVDLRSDELLVEVDAIDEVEIEEVHRWQPRLLDYDQILLGEIVEEFNSSNPIQVVLSDSSLESISLSSSFWSDNVEGFVRLMESSFGMQAEWRGSREIVLRKGEQ